MEISLNQQIYELVRKSKNIIIALPQNPSTDAVAGSLGLYLTLEKLGKRVKVVCAEFQLPPQHQFLPKSKEIYTDLSALRKFIITLDVSRTKVEELSYDIANDKLNIFITPKNGFYEPRDISTSASQFEHDLIFVLDSPDLDSLGKLYDDNTEFFYHTPIINIDHNPTNEYFGQINNVDLVATSTSEIIFELIRSFKESVMDDLIATSLLTGIISKTKSFQSANVTPKSLAIASHLIEQGARRDEIIKNLYQTKTVSTLKLWGRALARLRTASDGRVAWSLLNRQDFEKSGAAEQELEGVIDELIISMPGAKIIILLYEQEEKTIKVIINTDKTVDALNIFKDYKPQGNKNFINFSIKNKDIINAEKEIIGKAEASF